MKFYRFLLPLLLAGSWCAQSQNTISGKVATTPNQPLEGAHIHIEQLHGISNPGGYYELHNISSGRHRVVISYIGYASLDTVVDISENITLNALLKPEITQLQEVVLTESTVPKSTTHEQRLKTETIEKYSNATLGDALKEVAGVYTLKTGNNIVKPVINGLHSSRVPVFSNNVRLEDQQWGTEHAPNLDINAAGRISVIKGASALQYSGDAVGGLVLVEPMAILKDTLFGKTILSADSNGRGGSISSSVHKGAERGWAWNAGGTFKYMGDREAPDYILSNTGNREANFAGDIAYRADSYSLSASYSFYNATIGIAKATHIGNVTDLVRAINSGEPNLILPFTHDIDAPRQRVQHHLAKINFSKNFSDNAMLSLQYAFQLNNRKEYDIRTGDDAYKPALDLALVTHSVQADWKQVNDNTVLKAGISGAFQHNDANADTGIRPLIPTYDKYDAAAYGIYSYSFSDGFSGEAGLRYDFTHMDAMKFYQKTRWNSVGYNNGEFDDIITEDLGTQWRTNPQFTFHNVSASLGARYKPGNDLEVLSNISLAVRNPNPSELFSDGLHHSNSTIALGDLRTQKEKAVKLSATLLKTGGRFRFEATPYLNTIKDFIYLKPTKIEYTIRGSFPVYKYTQANAVLAGLDLHTDWDISNSFKHSFNFAYVHGSNTSDNLPLIDMPPLNIANAIRYTKTEWHSLYVELRNDIVFRQKRYPNYNFYTDIIENGEYVPVLVDVSTPPAGYALFHFAAGMQFNVGKATVGTTLSVNNIFNTSYRDYLNRQRFYADETGRNFQLQIKINY
jgi:iron complex outermembrane receptor protein